MKKIRDFLNKKRKGMTLVELMIVVVIIGIVFAYAFVNAGANTEKARKARTSEDIAAITSAVAMYVAGASDQDIALTDLTTDMAKADDTRGDATINKHLSKKLSEMKDGWGKAYTVTPNAKKVTIDCESTADLKKDLDNLAFTRILDFN